MVLIQSGTGPVSGAPSAITALNPKTGQVLLYPVKESYINTTFDSYLDIFNGGCYRYSRPGLLAPVLEPIDVTTLYTPPFRVR